MKWHLAASVAASVAVAGFAANSASATIITGVTATASSEIDLSIFGDFPRLASFVVDGSGLEPGGDDSAITADQRHYSQNGDYMNWMSSHADFNGVDPAPWFQVDLGEVHRVAGVRVFNYAEHGAGGDGSGAGVRHVNISVSDDGLDWTPVAANFEIAKANVPVAFEYNDFGTYYSVADVTGGAFSEASFRYMRLDILSNWNGNNVAYGLAELQFQGVVPEPSSWILLSVAAVGVCLVHRKRRG